MVESLPNTIIGWAVALIIGVPLLSILLNEIVVRMRRHESRYTRFFELMRSVLLPSAVAFVVVWRIFELGEKTTTYRIFTSLLLIAAAYVGFVLFNTIGAVRDRERWENQVPGLFKTVLRFVAVLYPLYLLTGTWGIDLSNAVAALGVGSLVIALALQDTLSSIVSGFLLVIDKPFTVGDWVEIDGYKGKVIDISWRSTRLQVKQLDFVVIPNVNIVGSAIYNLTMLNIAYRDEMVLGFSYDDPPNKVKQVLLDMTLDAPDVMHVPAPRIFTESYDDSSIAYRLMYYVAEYGGVLEELRIRDDIMTRVYYAAERNGLTIPFPIHIVGRPKDFEPDSKAIQLDILDFLQSNRYFSKLPETVLSDVAKETEIVPFAEGETVMAEGASSDMIGLVRSGELALSVANRQAVNGQFEALTLTAGDIVGEMALMGRRSSLASCIAVRDTSVLKLPIDQLSEIVERYPRFALVLNGLVEERINLLRELSVTDG